MMKKIRNMKVYETSGYHYKATPTIMLKGQWLKEAGFDLHVPIKVRCEDGMLVITRADRDAGGCEYALGEGTAQVSMVAEGRGRR